MSKCITKFASTIGLVFAFVLIVIPQAGYAAVCCCTSIMSPPVACSWNGTANSCSAGLIAQSDGNTSNAECARVQGNLNAALSPPAPTPPPTQPASTPTGSTALLNPLTGRAEGILPSVLYGNIIRILIGVAGILALLQIVLGGIKWMTSQGNEEKITEGKNALVWASLGLLVVLSSYIILNFVLGVFSKGVS